MFDDLTWDALLRAWPWFGAAAAVFVFAVGLFVALKSKPERQIENAAEGADKRDWTLTGRIDFADSQPVRGFILEVEETRISISPSGVEHGAFRWRRATLPEAKMVIESYHAQQNLLVSGTFTATTSIGTRRKVSGRAESVETELRDAGKEQDLAHVTLAPRDVTHAQSEL
jgi:hypothetical protein